MFFSKFKLTEEQSLKILYAWIILLCINIAVCRIEFVFEPLNIYRKWLSILSFCIPYLVIVLTQPSEKIRRLSEPSKYTALLAGLLFTANYMVSDDLHLLTCGEKPRWDCTEIKSFSHGQLIIKVKSKRYDCFSLDQNEAELSFERKFLNIFKETKIVSSIYPADRVDIELSPDGRTVTFTAYPTATRPQSIVQRISSDWDKASGKDYRGIQE
jgi:hypothetical protein